MARKPTVRYFPSRKAYYTQWQGQQHRLASGPDDAPSGPTYLAALTAFQRLMGQARVSVAQGDNTVQTIVDAYLRQAEGRWAPGSMKARRTLLQPFVRVLGKVRAADLTLVRLENFIARMRVPRRRGTRKCGWNDTTVATFINQTRCIFQWAVKRKLIPSNPVAELRAPHTHSRARRCLISTEEQQKVLAACRSQCLRTFIMALHNTGARPGELTHARGSDWNDELGAIVYYGNDRRRQDEFAHKTARHGKDRVIYFTGDILALVRARVKRHPGEPIFPSSRGRAYGEKSIQTCFWYLRKRVQMPQLIAYSYRHTFATNWLIAGRSIDILAELLGNTPEILRKHYSHIARDRTGIRRHLDDFTQAQSQRPGSK